MKKVIVLMMIFLFALSGCSKTDPSLFSDDSATTQSTLNEISSDSQLESADEVKNNSVVQTVTSEKCGFENGNLSAGGLMCGDENGWVYYRSEADHWNLYKAKIDGTEKTKICDDTPAYINVLDEWIYYCNYNDGFSIYRIRTDGNNREKLLDGYCGNLHVTSEKLYFDLRNENNAPQIYSADLDGSNKKLLVENLSVAAYYDGILYGRDTENLYAVNSVTDTMETIFAGYTHNVAADDNGIYFWAVDDGTFCRIDNNGNKTVLHSGGDFFTYADGELYYWSYGGENFDYDCIYCLDTLSGQTKTVLSLSPQYFDAEGNDLGITIRELRDGVVTPDESMIDPIDGEFKGFCESVNYTYVIDGCVFSRGTMRNSLLQTGKLDCWIQCNDAEGNVWD